MEEIAQLKARQTAAKLQLEADEKATQQRLAALYELQRPLCELLGSRRQLRLGISRCEAFHVGFSADAVAARETWHMEVINPARDPRGGRPFLHGVHDNMTRAESCKAECAKSLLILSDDLAELEAKIVSTAKEAKLEAILPPNFPADPLDE